MRLTNQLRSRTSGIPSKKLRHAETVGRKDCCASITILDCNKLCAIGSDARLSRSVSRCACRGSLCRRGGRACRRDESRFASATTNTDYSRVSTRQAGVETLVAV